MSQKVCECLVRKQYNKIYSVLGLSFVTSGFFGIVLCVLPAFFLEKILAMLGIQEDLGQNVKEMVFFCLAAFFIKSINDLLSQLMLCVGAIHKIGVSSVASVVFPIVLSILLISGKSSGFTGIWLSLLIH